MTRAQRDEIANIVRRIPSKARCLGRALVGFGVLQEFRIKSSLRSGAMIFRCGLGPSGVFRQAGLNNLPRRLFDHAWLETETELIDFSSTDWMRAAPSLEWMVCPPSYVWTSRAAIDWRPAPAAPTLGQYWYSPRELASRAG
jgi:hypothetical protein